MRTAINLLKTWRCYEGNYYRKLLQVLTLWTQYRIIMRQNWIYSRHCDYLNVYMEKNTLQLSETKAVESHKHLYKMDFKQAINLWTKFVIIETPEINCIQSVSMVTFLQQQSPITTADTRRQCMIFRKGGGLRREDFSENNVISKLSSNTYNTYVKQCAYLWWLHHVRTHVWAPSLCFLHLSANVSWNCLIP